MTYQCDFGYLPTLARNSTCVFNNDSMSYAWVPALESQFCLLRTTGKNPSFTDKASHSDSIDKTIVNIVYACLILLP